MDIFYRLFYTVFSMSCMIVVLTPIVLFLRLLFRKLPKKFTMVLWMIFYLRAICPIGMSSPVCLSGAWNRRFHLLLKSIGLTMKPEGGILTSWFRVYQSQLEVTFPYMVCTVLWFVGAVGILICTWKRQHDIKRGLKDAERLYDNVYQSKKLQSPMRTGFFRRRIYLPEGLSAKELKNILFHQQLHCKRKDDWLGILFFVVSCIHWWNPCIWLAYYLAGTDREVSCDEAAARKIGPAGRAGYAQDILNMKREGNGSLPHSLVTFQEEQLSKRAEHILYMERCAVWKKASAAFLLTVCFFCWFAMSALHTAWNGGSWNNAEAVQEEILFQEEPERGITNEVIASCESQTPAGNTVQLELLMTQGTYQKSIGYTGQCILRMRDESNETLASLVLSRVFSGETVQQFNEMLQLAVDDYNEDGVMEVSLGQKMEVEASKLSVPATKGAVTAGTDIQGEPENASQGDNQETSVEDGTKSSSSTKQDNEKKTVYGFYLINLEEDTLRIISEPIYVSQVTDLQAGSMVFSYIEDAGGVITTQLEQETAYYVWDKEDKMYYWQNMTQEEIDARISIPEETAITGETSVYSLENDEGKTVVQVAAQTDESGGQSIENVTVNPKGVDELKGAKAFTNISGYYVNLQWATVIGEEQRYAELIYNGDRGQTFVVYDVKKKKEYYKQKNGNKTLQEIFTYYDETDIVFVEDDIAVYSLMELEEDGSLQIGFAANVEGGTVQGSYKYDVSTEQTSNFQYTWDQD